MKSKAKCHHCGRSKGHVRNCIVMVAKHGIRLPAGTTANERAKNSATWPGLKDKSGAARVATQAVKTMREAIPDETCQGERPPVKTCDHKSNEDCMTCRDCGECSESLNSADRCADCVKQNEKDDATVKLDASDVATILAALRLFQDTYRDCGAVQIADAWPMHFNVQSPGGEVGGQDVEDELLVEPPPLGSEDVDDLCERINCAKTLTVV
jgi:hypothetical protein